MIWLGIAITAIVIVGGYLLSSLFRGYLSLLADLKSAQKRILALEQRLGQADQRAFESH